MISLKDTLSDSDKKVLNDFLSADSLESLNAFKATYGLQHRFTFITTPILFEPLSLLSVAAMLGKALHLNFLLKQKKTPTRYWRSATEAVFAADERDNLALRLASENGQLDIVKALLAYTSVQHKVHARHNEALRFACRGGHLKVVKYLLIFPSVRQHLSDKHYVALAHAAKLPDTSILFHLLTFNDVFAFADATSQKNIFWCKPLRAYSKHWLKKLKANDHALSQKEKIHGYCVLRFLIRQNQDQDLDDIQYLIHHPSILPLLHRQIDIKKTQGQPNQLLRLARLVGHDKAEQALLEINAVRAQAMTDAFYPQDAFSGPSMRTLSGLKESSMEGLTLGEVRQVRRLAQYYQDALKEAGGPAKVLLAFKARLKQAYRQNPASIVIGRERVILPLAWDAFDALKQTSLADEANYNQALKAYYQHPYHSAYRYFLKPNRWMAEDAEDVIFIDSEQHLAHANFEAYIKPIALLFLAMTDTNIDGQDRFDCLANQIALLTRAKNWQEQIKQSTTGPIVIEQDDLQGDKPSCDRGVRRRLFQTGFGHPLFDILQLSTVKQELNDFIHATYKRYFKRRPNLKEKVRHALASYIEDINDSVSLSIIKRCNLSQKSMRRFIQYMEKKYQDNFTTNPYFYQYIRKQFKLSSNRDAHIIQFGTSLSHNTLNATFVGSKLSC